FQTVLSQADLMRLREAMNLITVRPELIDYAVDVIRHTREHDSILAGAGPRATQALILASRAYAAIAGRDFVSPDDIKTMTIPVLIHRLILRPEFEIEGLTIAEVVQQLLQEIAVPR
ncbi:MAG: MoxR-like ATPase, partial [Verrucomicrobiales bacterium]